MYTSIDICLAVLGGLWLGAAIGVIAGGMSRACKRTPEGPLFHVPDAHREFEADGTAPRQYD